MLRVELRVSLREDDPAVDVLRRLSLAGERRGSAARRVLYRYKALLDNTTHPDAEVVRELYSILSDNQDMLYGDGYPRVEDVIAAIERAAIPPGLRDRLAGYIQRLTFAEYAKLVEAVERMLHAGV